MVTESPPTFGALLQHYRLAAGLSQEALAERASVSARAISDLERGQRLAPYPHTVQQLARALRLAAADRERLMETVPRRNGRAGDGLTEFYPATNLPAPVTTFVGRDRELIELRQLLGATRLLTLTGPGGVGKTRLAVEVARVARDEHRDGVWLVELAALAAPDQVVRKVARVLGMTEQPGQPLLETLVSACAARRLLLVLDNCEHLIVACAELVEALLRGCPDLRVLAASREALGLTGEVAWPTPPLTLPDLDRLPAPDQLARCDAVRLFIDRAAAVRPSFALTPHNAPAVARLCVQLDGIPLALELAAARVKGLPPEELATRLDQRFRLLTAGSRTAPPRQQTLRATVDWSHALLSEPERTLLRRLAVFAGGWTLAAAEAVGAGDAIACEDLLDLLLRLVDKSLVMATERDGEPRYRLLETIRQYAWERLREADEEAVVRDLHRDWCLALAERAEFTLRGPEQAAWLDRLDDEHDNVRAALAWTLVAAEPGRPGGGDAAAAGLRIAGAMSWFWFLRHRGEGVAWLDQVLAHSEGATTAARAKALCAAGCLRMDLEDRLKGQALIAESVALYRSLGDARGLAHALVWLGRYPRGEGWDYAGGTAMFEEALRLARDVGDRGLIAEVLVYEACTADLARVGEASRAQAAADEALALFRTIKDTFGISQAQLALAKVARWRGDNEHARAAYVDALTAARALGDMGGVISGLVALAEVVLAQGDPAGAVAYCRESLALAHAMGWRGEPARSLDRLARVATEQGQSLRAARLLGAADADRRVANRPRWLAAQPAHEATVRAARAALGEAGFVEAWTEGQAMSLDEAVAYALADEPDSPA